MSQVIYVYNSDYVPQWPIFFLPSFSRKRNSAISSNKTRLLLISSFFVYVPFLLSLARRACFNFCAQMFRFSSICFSPPHRIQQHKFLLQISFSFLCYYYHILLSSSVFFSSLFLSIRSVILLFEIFSSFGSKLMLSSRQEVAEQTERWHQYRTQKRWKQVYSFFFSSLVWYVWNIWKSHKHNIKY